MRWAHWKPKHELERARLNAGSPSVEKATGERTKARQHLHFEKPPSNTENGFTQSSQFLHHLLSANGHSAPRASTSRSTSRAHVVNLYIFHGSRATGDKYAAEEGTTTAMPPPALAVVPALLDEDELVRARRSSCARSESNAARIAGLESGL